MPTFLEQALRLRFPPLAIFYAQEPPAGASMPGALCSMLLVALAAKGKTVALGAETCPCHGAAGGWGLTPMHPERFPGGRECFLRFLSVGNQDHEEGRAVLRQLEQGGAPRILVREFAEGEGFLKTPELTARWLADVPPARPEGPWVVIRPLAGLEPGERPKVVTFPVDPDQLSALTVLANFAGPGTDNVRIPFGAGCACFGLLPFAEAESAHPRAVVGLTDISARYYLRKPLGRDILSFTVPLRMFEAMEADAPESFLARFAWKSMTGT
jgi:hypothetical protein